MQKFLFAFFVLSLIVFNSFAQQQYVSTYAGMNSPGFVDSTLSQARFNKPFGMCIDKSHNLYVADADNHSIRKINTDSGIVTTIAGTGVAGFLNGRADSAQFNSPSDLCVDDSGNVYVSDFLNHRIRKISTDGYVTTVAGSGFAGFYDGVWAIANFNYPRGICIDKNGSLYVGDSWNHRIRKIDIQGNVTTYAGGGTAVGVGTTGSLIDAADTSARFHTPSGLAIDEIGNIYVADAYNHRIRMIDTSRNVTTLVGSGPVGQNNGGYANGTLLTSVLNTPTELFVDTNTHTLYISDTFNNRIRKADITNDAVTTFAGNGTASYSNDFDTLAAFNFPRGVVKDSISVYVADYNNHSIRLIHPLITPVVGELSDDQQLIVYPNPVSDELTITGDFQMNLNYRVIDSKGRIIFQDFTDKNLLTLDVSKFDSGIYLLIFNNSVSKRFVVQH